MTLEDFKKLQPGDAVHRVSSPGTAYVVHANYGNRVTAVRTADLTNPGEWDRATRRLRRADEWTEDDGAVLWYHLTAAARPFVAERDECAFYDNTMGCDDARADVVWVPLPDLGNALDALRR